nr:MAG TPA: hypothetical protein [Bacteriophage sp.]
MYLISLFINYSYHHFLADFSLSTNHQKHILFNQPKREHYKRQVSGYGSPRTSAVGTINYSHFKTTSKHTDI